MRRLERFSIGQFCISLGLTVFWLLSSPVAAQTESAADFLPKTTAIYLHVEKPADLIEKLETHPVVNHVMEMKQVEELMRQPQVAMLMLGRGMFETQIGEDLMTSLKSNMARGLWLAVDTKTEGVVIAFRAKDEERLKRVAGQALKLVAATAQNNGQDVPYEKGEYKNAVAAEFDDFLIARWKDWFLVTNKPKLAKVCVDNLEDGTLTPLSSQSWFKEAMAKRDQSDVWAAIDLETIRKISDNNPAFQGQTDNPGVELIFGGILDALKNSPTALANLKIDEHVDLSFASPFDKDWANEHRDFFFGSELSGLAPKALTPKNMIASLTSYRDVGAWWLSKEDLYPENVIAQLAQADSQLSTIFSGMDFGEDVLGSLQPGVQLVVAENKYDEKYVPDVQVPAFALVGKIKEKEMLQRKLRIAFQSLIGFTNINLGMNGQPQLEVETEKIGDVRLSTASYFYEEGTEEGLILFNFAPSVAFKGDHMIISSNRDLAVELADLIGTESTEEVNTRLRIDGKMLNKILRANQESLIAQNMLEEGNDRDEAETQIELVLKVAELFKDFGLDYQVDSTQMKLDMSLRFENVSDSAKGSE